MDVQDLRAGSLTFFGDVFEFNYQLETVGLEVVGVGRLTDSTSDVPLLSDGRLGLALSSLGKGYTIDHIELIDLGHNRLNLRGVALKRLHQLLKGVPSVQSAKEADRLAAASDYVRQFRDVDGGPGIYQR